MGSQPNHRDVCSALNELCAQTASDVEAQLVEQKKLDEAEARRLAEEEKKREEMTRLLAEQEEKVRLEKVKQMEQDQRDIEAVERELDARKQALRDAQKAADIDDDDNNDNDDDDDERDSESTAEGRQVCPYCCILIL